MEGPLNPTPPSRATLRASDADRERTATLLQEGYSEGRLTLEELQDRLQHAYGAKTLGDLDALTVDLIDTTRHNVTAPTGNAAQTASRRRHVRERIMAYVLIMLFLVAIWAASGAHGSFWPIWPIVVGAFILAFDILGLERPDSRRRQRRVDHRRGRGNMDADDHDSSRRNLPR